MSIQLEILYEDYNIIAVNKPEGISSISENDLHLPTIHSILQNKYSQKIYVVHRIDKEVSGIILFAKDSLTHKYLNSLFATRAIKKNYTALVHGVILEERGRIDKPIREFGSGRMGVDEKNGKRSITDFKVLKRFNDFTLLDVSIITGRRHQIRVHLYSIGHPVAGDLLYGNKNIQSRIPRLMLHASNIEFKLQNNKNVLISSLLPDTFQKFIDVLH
ncbi:MAG: RNA pseudouridine synthase [Bacteroidota bacterium]|jgi:RluA family pseudouridine synthase